jgi:hypothetical protein
MTTNSIIDCGVNCTLINFSEVDALKILCKSLEEKNSNFEADNKHLKEDYKKLYEDFKKFKNEANKLQTNLNKLEDENKQLRKPKVPVKVATQSVGITCAFSNDMDYIVKTQIKTIEKLSHDYNNERELSMMMSVSNAEKDKLLKEKDSLIEREKTLRMDLQYMLDTLRMYLEIEMMKLSTEINTNGLRGFTAVAFNMYRGYCEGLLEKMITEAVEARTKSKV